MGQIQTPPPPPPKNTIQGMLDKPNPDFDPNSAASKKRRAEFQEDPVADIYKYLGVKK